MRETDHGVDQFVLAVALNARNADDLSAVDLKAHAFDGFVSALVSDVQIVTRKCHSSHFHVDFGNLEDDVAADHHASQFLFVRVLLVYDALQLAATQDRYAIGDLHNLFQLVTDEQDRLSLGLQFTHGHEQLDSLFRREDGRGLIENEDLSTSAQHLEDFDTLLDADGQVAHKSRGVHGQRDALRELPDFAHCPAVIKEDTLVRLIADDDVLGDGEPWNQHELLVHHAHPELDGILDRTDPDFVLVDQEVSARCCVDAVDDVHQSTLARAVFADDGKNLSLLDRERDVVVRKVSGEHLGDAAYFQCFHGLTPLQRRRGQVLEPPGARIFLSRADGPTWQEVGTVQAETALGSMELRRY